MLFADCLRSSELLFSSEITDASISPTESVPSTLRFCELSVICSSCVSDEKSPAAKTVLPNEVMLRDITNSITRNCFIFFIRASPPSVAI